MLGIEEGKSIFGKGNDSMCGVQRFAEHGEFRGLQKTHLAWTENVEKRKWKAA